MTVTEIREGDEFFTDPVECRQCQWVGFVGDLIAGMKPKPYCPECGSMEIGAVQIVRT